jgi:HEAT repeat protein
MGHGASEVPRDERDLWLQEVAVQIARTGTGGVKFLLAFVPYADASQLRAILVALSLSGKKLLASQRAEVCDLGRRLLKDRRALVVAEAVDTLNHLECREAEKAVAPLLQHASPYVVGSALRFFARLVPEKAGSLLKKALKSPEPIVRQNAIDELDELQCRDALTRIRRLLDDPDDDVRQAAETAVAHLEKESH